VGVDAIAGTPNVLAAGSVRSALATLLGAVNSHITKTNSAHAASAISVLDSGNNLNANNVETALAEMLDALEKDHFRGNESNAGQHRTIHQPALGGSKALILDSNASGQTLTRFRIYADGESVWFTLNASWNGSQWARDHSGAFSSAIRFSRSQFELLHENSFAATFATWSRGWRLPMGGTINSAFECSGTVRETGRLGMQATNSFNTTRTISVGGAVTFRSRFPATPSSITLMAGTSFGFSSLPTVYSIDRDGFGFYSYQLTAADGTVYWFGSYIAVA
jgi:hypothetical protein